MKILVVLLLPVLLSACSGIKFKSNISPDLAEYVQDSVAADKVIEYSVEEIQRYQSSGLGLLIASSCQQGVNSPKPSKYSIKHDLKYQTQGVGGNGYVIMECSNDFYPGCYAYLECRALAFDIDFGNS
ncbi:hypothetical protein [Shewanella sp.]|uniref:hypothetical protein n=1 Tax=Shewanella sp. TaxID=50422 RepID=UPI002582D00C|nr:hypothetical protein [Shewanella sp.]MCJ8305005.1 hypothetical protein [Shewanella sp.]